LNKKLMVFIAQKFELIFSKSISQTNNSASFLLY